MAAKKRSRRDDPPQASNGKRRRKAAEAAPEDITQVDPETAPDADAPREGFPIVAIGCSAGGLDALRRFLIAMPAHSGLALVLIQHLDPTRESLLAELLMKHTDCPVIEVSEHPEGVEVQPDHIYVIVPDRELKIRNGRLWLSPFSEKRGHRRPVDTFFRSLAMEQKERGIAVVLTGTGSNGSEGLKAVKAEGGVVIAQSPETAEFDGMPRSAIKTGLVDFVLPIEQMPTVILGYAQHPYVRQGRIAADEESAWHQINEILALLNARAGHDFHNYKRGTLMRRISRRMGLLRIERLAEYAQHLREHPDELQNLVKDLLISVTSFFRDPEAWKSLERDVIIPLVRDRQGDTPIRVWVPACSTGEEAYTIAMLLNEHLELSQKQCPVKVFATDPGAERLSYARAGLYPDSIEMDLTPERIRRYFDKADNTFQVKKQFREMVVYAPQNLLSDPPFSRLDLITCRNLLIYLEPEMQQKVIALFHFALNEGGHLLLGNAETIGRQDDLFVPVSKKWRIYRKVGPTQHDRVDFPLSGHEHRLEREDLSRPGRQRKANVPDMVQRALLADYAPASVLVDEKYQVLYFHGATEPFLSQPSGPPTRDVRSLVREGLLSKLRNAIHRAQKEGRRVTVTGGRIRRGQEMIKVAVTAAPLMSGDEAEQLLLVSFEEESQRAMTTEAGNGEPAATLPSQLAVELRLEDELRTTREELESTIEELETSNEELKASNEEITSINEELQSTNEELETSKEELQSLNEELNTVNHQLQAKLEELERATNDVSNLLTSTDIATLFLDTQFRIRRFTPAMTNLLRLVSTDIGRPISDLAQRYADDSLLSDAEAVFTKLIPVEKEIQTDSEQWYIRRVLPYRTEDHRIDGVVVTFTEFTARKRAEDELRTLNQSLEQVVEQRTLSVRLLQDVTVIANEAATVEEALRKTLDRGCRWLNWPIGHAYLADDRNPSTFVSNGAWSVTAPEKYQSLIEAAEALQFQEGDDLVGRVIATGKPEWIGDISATDNLNGRELLTGHGIRSAAAFPIRVRDRVAGVLIFFDDRPAQPDPQLMQGLDPIGTQIGRVIERVQLQREVARMAEQEQQRFSHELHDGIAQQLTGLAMMAESYRQDLQAANAPQAARAADLVRHITEIQRQVRNMARGLMPVEVDAEGLMAALRGLCDRTEEMSGLDCRFECDEPVRIENSTSATHLYHIAQEAMHNALKHAEATELVIRLELEQASSSGDAQLTLTVRDNGNGMADSEKASAGMGQRIMNYRAGLIGATLEIRCKKDHGTAVICRLRQKRLSGDTYRSLDEFP